MAGIFGVGWIVSEDLYFELEVAENFGWKPSLVGFAGAFPSNSIPMTHGWPCWSVSHPQCDANERVTRRTLEKHVKEGRIGPESKSAGIGSTLRGLRQLTELNQTKNRFAEPPLSPLLPIFPIKLIQS